MAKESVRLGTVQETLLIPLYGRALDAKARRPILRDDRARTMVESPAWRPKPHSPTALLPSAHDRRVPSATRECPYD
ncbi:hypothetical protein ACFVV7_13470 [Streptomyces globisporus]|uniref:hypothetical protein n=1 Tax=Streptomyces globisporus TaxID=1908 RepID=UPI0036D8D8D0